MKHSIRKSIALVLALCMTLLTWTVVPVSAAEIELAPGTGLASTIRGAAGGDTIILTDGVYYVQSSVSIGKQLTIKAAPWTHPIIFGGKQLTGWEVYSGNIYRAPYTQAVTAMMENGKAGKIATSPTYKATGTSGNNTIRGTVPSGLTNNYAKVMTYGATNSNWQSSVNVITSTSGNSLTFSGNTVRGINTGCSYEIINDKVVIDEPGEFAYDGQYVYYYPYNTANLTSKVSVATTQTIFSISQAGDLTLEGVDIAGVNSQHNNGYFAEGGSAISVNGKLTATNCNFYAIDTNAIRYNGTAGMTVDHCTFDGIGGCAFHMNGSNGTVSNCEIYNTGVYAYGTISIGGNNNLISHNRIAHSAVRGINLGGAGSTNGWGNVIEYNDVFDCNTKVSDTGLIYLYRMDGATSTQRNTIRYNAFHDSISYNSMGFGIYLDDDADYTDVYGNWVYNLKGDAASNGFLMGPIMIKGVDSKVYDNVVANCRITPDNSEGAGNNNAVFVLQALSGYTTKDNYVYNNIISGISGNNRLYRTIGTDNSLKVADYNVYDKSPGSYSMSANSSWNVEMWQNRGFDTHSLWGVDPQFTDAANGDFTVNNPSITSDYYNNALTKDQLGPQAAEAADPTEAPTAQPDDAVVTVGETYVSAGDGTVDVEVPVNLSKVNADVAGFQLRLNYSKGITLKEVKKGTILPSLTFSTSADITTKPFILLWDGEFGDTQPNGLAATLIFTVPVDKKADYEVVVAVDSLYDNDIEDIPVFVKTGKIHVADLLLGDLNGDGKRDAKDITLLRRAITSQTSAAEKPSGDWNGDNKLDAKDITLLRRFIAGGGV